MAKEMPHEEDSDSDNAQHDTNDDATAVNGPTVFPKFSVTNLKSQVGILRIIQMVLCMLAFIFLQVSIKCKWVHGENPVKEYYIQLCQCPSNFIYRCYSASTAVVFFVTLVMFCLHVSNLMEVLSNISWSIVILAQTASSSTILVLAVAVLGHGNYVDDSGILIAVHFFGLFASVTFALHFFWELILWRKSRLPSSGKSDTAQSRDNITYASDYDCSAPDGGYSFNVVDDDDGDVPGGYPSGSSPAIRSMKKRNSYSLEMMSAGDAPPSWNQSDHHSYSASEGADRMQEDGDTKATSGSTSSRSAEGVDRSLHGYHSNSSGSEDKRSWVITGGAKEDTMSTDTYTVEASSN